MPLIHVERNKKDVVHDQGRGFVDDARRGPDGLIRVPLGQVGEHIADQRASDLRYRRYVVAALARPRRSDQVADDLTENTAALQEPIGELLQRIGRRVCTAFLGHTNPAPTARAAQTEPNRRPLAPRVPHPRGHKGRSLPADGASLASRQNREVVPSVVEFRGDSGPWFMVTQ